MKTANIFGRVNAMGYVEVLHSKDGAPVTKLDANVWPVGSSLSASYEHPQGIVLEMDDAKKLGIEIE